MEEIFTCCPLSPPPLMKMRTLGDIGLWVSQRKGNSAKVYRQGVQYTFSSQFTYYLTGIKYLMKLLWWTWPQDATVRPQHVKSKLLVSQCLKLYLWGRNISPVGLMQETLQTVANINNVPLYTPRFITGYSPSVITDEPGNCLWLVFQMYFKFQFKNNNLFLEICCSSTLQIILCTNMSIACVFMRFL